MKLYWNWKLVSFTALFLPLTIGLGIWQLHRAEEKQSLEVSKVERQRPIAFSSIQRSTGKLAYQRVTLQGNFVTPYAWLLDNQVVNGRVGYDVLGLLQEYKPKGNGRLLLINRGWIPQGKTRQQMPNISHPSGLLDLQGVIHVPTGQPLVLLPDKLQQSIYPQLLQTIDTVSLQQSIGLPLFDYMLRLDQNSDAALQAHWTGPVMTSAKHMGYAWQWFGLALVLFILFIYQTVSLTAAEAVVGTGKRYD
jgi:surfeit locus 1 family protein